MLISAHGAGIAVLLDHFPLLGSKTSTVSIATFMPVVVSEPPNTKIFPSYVAAPWLHLAPVMATPALNLPELVSKMSTVSLICRELSA